MKGHLLLEGGAEFVGKMAEPDMRALELAGGWEARVSILPTAAAPDHNDRHAGQNGVRWFEQLGATHVSSLPLVDPASANLPSLAQALRDSRLIYLLGGFPRYLGETLANSSSWQAVLQAYAAGAVVGGSSAGAMVLCEHYYDPETQSIQPGLTLIPAICVIPHYDTFGNKWPSRLSTELPGVLLLGIDEQTGLLDDGPDGEWTVYGKGSVTLFKEDKAKTYRAGESLALSF